MKKLFKLPVLAAVMAALLICATAFAAATTGSKTLPVNKVSYNQQAGYTQLLIQFKEGSTYTNTYANPGQGVAADCPINAPTLETTKVWLSMAQASVLSGRNLTVSYTTCTGGWNWITAIDLGP
jgi:hypothetical protein